MKKILTAIVVIIILIVIGLFIAVHHATSVATKTANNLFAQLQKQNPTLIKSVTHGKISAGLSSLTSGAYTVKDVEITLLKFPKNPIVVNSLKINNFQTDGKVPAHFQLQFKGIHIAHLQEALMNQANQLNVKYTPKGKAVTPMPDTAVQIIHSLKPTLDMSFTYKQDNKTLLNKLSLSNNKNKIFWATNTFADFELNDPISLKLSKKNPLVVALLNAYSQSGEGQFNYAIKLSAAQILKAAPFMATPLGLLGYSDLDFAITGHSKVSEKHSSLNYDIKLANGFELNFDMQANRLKHVLVKDYIRNIMLSIAAGSDGVKPPPLKDISIEKMQLMFTDHSILSRANKVTESMFKMGLPKVGMMLMAVSEKTPYSKWTMPLVELLKHQGGQVTATLTPKQPYYPSNFEKWGEQIQNLQKSQSVALKKKDFKAYEALNTRIHALNMSLLKALNLNVTYQPAK